METPGSVSARVGLQPEIEILQTPNKSPHGGLHVPPARQVSVELHSAQAKWPGFAAMNLLCTQKSVNKHGRVVSKTRWLQPMMTIFSTRTAIALHDQKGSTVCPNLRA
jgi:hypothetical protein